MSYQFEDDSALEKLLNQQLDRKRQPVARVAISARPQPTSSNTKKDILSDRPSTGGLSKQPLFSFSKQPSEILQAQDDQTPPRGKLASWLQSDPSAAKVVEKQNVLLNNQDSSPSTGEQRKSSLKESYQVDLDTGELDLSQGRLQEMSKQRLIQLILVDIAPTLKQLKQINSEQPSGDEYKKVKEKLQEERAKVELIEQRHREQLQMVEDNWQRLNNQLERNVSLAESQLTKTIDTLKGRLECEQLEHEESMSKLAKNYQLKLNETKEELEAKLKRREELHKLELESKLKIDCNMVKLETIFSEWSKMLEKTIEDLANQFKLVECLLDKQTLEIKGTNESVEGKGRVFNEKLQMFEKQIIQTSELMSEFKINLPKFFNLQQENEQIAKQTSVQLGEFFNRFTELCKKEQQCQEMQDNLFKSKEEFEKDKLQLLLDSNRLTYKEERLNELLALNESKEMKLEHQKSAQLEREAQLEKLKGSLIQQTALIKEQNYELHLVRRRLTGKEDELSRLENNLSERENCVKREQTEIRAQANKFATLRLKAQKELNQLRRVQKSLICSICLDRLFNGQQQSPQPIDSKWTDQQFIPSQMKQRLASNCNQLAESNQLAELRDELDVDKVLIEIEHESQQLDTESKYAKLLSRQGN